MYVLLAIAFLIAIFGACAFIWTQNRTYTNDYSIDTISTDSIEDIEPENVNQVEIKKYSYKRKVGDSQVDYSIDYPIAGNQNLTRNVVEWINESFGGRYKGDLKDAQSIVDFYGKEVEFSNEYNTEEKTYIKLKFQTEKYVTFEYSSFSSEGGAHGFGQTICATFRKDDGRKFGWNMFSNYEGLQPALKQGLKRYFEVTTDQELEEHLQLPEGNTINSFPMPSTDPWLTPDGLTMHYGAYEIACYAEGEPTFTIPFSKIKNCLTTTAADLISE